MSKKFYIIGCQRSGTTLLRLILESHSEIYCYDENNSYRILGDKQKLADITIEKNDKKFLGFKIPRFTEQLANKKLDHYNLPFEFENFYQNEPLLFIVRDVRDVVCSMNSLSFNASNWLHEKGIPGLEYHIKKSEKLRREYESEINIAKNSNDYELSMGSLYWKYKNKSYFNYLKNNFPITKIIYEDLVTYPKETITSLVEFLDVKWEDSLLQHDTLVHTETNEKGLTVGSTNVNMPIKSFHVGRYKEELTENQLNDIMSISGDLMKMFGYDF